MSPLQVSGKDTNDKTAMTFTAFAVKFPRIASCDKTAKGEPKPSKMAAQTSLPSGWPIAKKLGPALKVSEEQIDNRHCLQTAEHVSKLLPSPYICDLSALATEDNQKSNSCA